MTVPPKTPSDHDLQLLSAYLDGALSNREKAMLEQQLAHDPALRSELDHLRDTVTLLRDLPRLKAPRNLTLDPQHYARPLPWWKRLFTLDMALQLSGALGAAASLILIVAAVLLTGNNANEAKVAQEGQAASEQAASQVALQSTATAIRRTLTVDDAAAADETAIGFAGEGFQTTLAAQSAYYATREGATPVVLPSEVPAPAAEADQAESATFSTETQTEGEIGAAPSAEQPMPAAPLGAEESNTMMQQDEGYAPAEPSGAADGMTAGAGGPAESAAASGAGGPPQPGLAAPPAAFAPTMPGTPTPAAANAFREEQQEASPTEALQALENEPAFTQTPAEAAAAVTNTPQSTPVEKRGPGERAEEESAPDWSLIGLGVIVLAMSALLFGIGRRMARG